MDIYIQNKVVLHLLRLAVEDRKFAINIDDLLKELGGDNYKNILYSMRDKGHLIIKDNKVTLTCKGQKKIQKRFFIRKEVLAIQYGEENSDLLYTLLMLTYKGGETVYLCENQLKQIFNDEAETIAKLAENNITFTENKVTFLGEIFGTIAVNWLVFWEDYKPYLLLDKAGN